MAVRSAVAVLLCASASSLSAAPDADGTSTCRTGEAIFVKGASARTKGIILSEPDDIMGRRFSAGFYPQVREDARYSYHAFARSPGEPGIGYLSGFKDARSLRAGKEKVQLCVSLPATALGVKVCDTQHDYRRTEISAPSAAGQRLELTYDGKIGSVIRVGYHERNGVGPSATQKDGTLELDLTETRTMTYQDIRLKIVAADATQLRYRVITGP